MAQALTAALIGFVTGSVFLSLAYHDILTRSWPSPGAGKIAHHADTPCAPRFTPRVDLGSSRALAARPRLLFLAQVLPYPPHSGVAARTLHLLEELRRAFDIDLGRLLAPASPAECRARDAAWRALRAVASSRRADSDPQRAVGGAQALGHMRMS